MCVTLLLLVAACNGNSADERAAVTEVPTSAATATDGIDPADFSSTVDNEYFPLEPGAEFVYEGSETDPDTGETIALRVEARVLDETETVAGVEVRVVEVMEFEDGELVESTLDYYAQHHDGTVYYMGEHVDDYEDGEVVGHSGQWLAGEGDALPGVFMPATPALGDVFEQERAPGIAEDRSTVVSVDDTVTVAAGSFEGCLRTEDEDPLGGSREFKQYCRGVGLIREEAEDGSSTLELVSRT
jgi:hypothetical protein